jgi:integrase
MKISERTIKRLGEIITGDKALSPYRSGPKLVSFFNDFLGIPVGTMHAFRHGRASQMQTAGLPGDFVTSQIGHSSLKITSLYTHFEHEKKRALAEQLLSCTQTGDLNSTAN